MDIALFALLRNKTANLKTFRKEMSLVKLHSSKREEPVIEALDVYALSNYIETKASVSNGQHDGIQRSASEASLFFRYSSPEQFHKLARFPHSQRSALKSSIRRGLMMLPGNILLMKAAQSDRKQQIRFGVKSSVGQRPYMEDSHIMKPFFFRFPISLACTRQLIPEFVQTELDKVTLDTQIGDDCSWSSFKTEMPSKDGSVHCVFDEFDLFLICDGHGGAQVSQYCTANFNKILKRQLKASVEERYLELLQSVNKSGHESESTLSSAILDGLPERRVKSANNLGEGTQHHSLAPPLLERGGGNGSRRLKPSESVRERGTGNLTDTVNKSSKKGPPSAQCGLDVDHLGDCLSRSFQQLDAEVKEQKLGDFEGSTALAALVGSWHICIANCGDSRAVLSRNGVAVRLTRDHKPYIEEERSRIEQDGGFVLNAYGCSRVNGFLAMSRAIGDHLIPSVIAQPDVTILHRHPTDEFLICATDGLWDVITDEEACEMTRKCLARAEAKGARKLSSRVAANVLLKAAIDKGSTDNITIAVVDLRTGQESKSARRM